MYYVYKFDTTGDAHGFLQFNRISEAKNFIHYSVKNKELAPRFTHGPVYRKVYYYALVRKRAKEGKEFDPMRQDWKYMSKYFFDEVTNNK